MLTGLFRKWKKDKGLKGHIWKVNMGDDHLIVCMRYTEKSIIVDSYKRVANTFRRIEQSIFKRTQEREANRRYKQILEEF